MYFTRRFFRKCKIWMRLKCYRIKPFLLAVAFFVFFLYALDLYIVVLLGGTHCVFVSPESLLEELRLDNSTKGKCQVDLDTLGRVKLDMLQIPTFDEIALGNKHVQNGGLWKPRECEAWQKVAVVIPYRDRLVHLKRLLLRLHDMLRNQKLNYRIFVVEQAGNGVFNKGRLMNIGYLEALEHDVFDCFVFHDVDMLPENDKNLYMCNKDTRHLSSAIDTRGYRLTYCNLVGGTVAISSLQMRRVNGFSNSYWGWGKEDDDFAARSIEAGITVTNTPESIGTYTASVHSQREEVNRNNELFLSWRGRWIHDGLNSIIYTITEKTDNRLYTNITVDVGSMLNYMMDTTKNRKTESPSWRRKFYRS